MTQEKVVDRVASRDGAVTVVRTIDDFLKAAAIRAVVYLEGQDCPYEEEFDGNDLAGLQLLGWVGGEPAATLRIRFFADFAKLERLAVRPAFRRSSIAFSVVRQGLRIVRRKGYRTAYGHARAGLEPFWARFGARPLGRPGAFTFSGQAYTEMVVDLPEAEDALRLGVDPLVINRPEGDWDRPGVLEKGASVAPASEDVTYAHTGIDGASGWSPDLQQAWKRWAGGLATGGGFDEEGMAWSGYPGVEHRLPHNPRSFPRRARASFRIIRRRRSAPGATGFRGMQRRLG